MKKYVNVYVHLTSKCHQKDVVQEKFSARKFANVFVNHRNQQINVDSRNGTKTCANVNVLKKCLHVDVLQNNGILTNVHANALEMIRVVSLHKPIIIINAYANVHLVKHQHHAVLNKYSAKKHANVNVQVCLQNAMENRNGTVKHAAVNAQAVKSIAVLKRYSISTHANVNA